MHLHVYLLGFLRPQDKGRPIYDVFSKINLNFYFPQPLRTPWVSGASCYESWCRQSNSGNSHAPCLWLQDSHSVREYDSVPCSIPWGPCLHCQERSRWKYASNVWAETEDDQWAAVIKVCSRREGGYSGSQCSEVIPCLSFSFAHNYLPPLSLSLSLSLSLHTISFFHSGAILVLYWLKLDLVHQISLSHLIFSLKSST